MLQKRELAMIIDTENIETEDYEKAYENNGIEDKHKLIRNFIDRNHEETLCEVDELLIRYIDSEIKHEINQKISIFKKLNNINKIICISTK